MKKLILFSTFALLVLAFISCEKEHLEPVTDINDQEVMITTRSATDAFKARLRNVINSDYTYFDEDGNLHEEINGTGKATNLGICSWYSLTTVYDVAVTEPSPPFVQDGTMTFTAADGSTLYGHYWGYTTPCNEDCFFAGNGDWQITAGTKRFVRTTGTGKYSYVARMDDEGNVTSELEFTGRLANP